jgi:hypothetical protein
MTNTLDKKIIIKNSTKKLVIHNLCRIFGESITFVGSINDFFYANLSMSEIKDIDVKVNFSEKEFFLNKLLTSDFFIFSHDKKKYTIKPYRTYEPIRNFGTHITSYVSGNLATHKYGYHLFIFGVCLDISFRIDTYSSLIKYHKFLNLPDENKIGYNPDIFYLIKDKKFHTESKETRLNFLRTVIYDKKYPEKIREKHRARLALYENIQDAHLINKFNYSDRLDSIPTFYLPNGFDPWTYKELNMGSLKVLTTKDALIDHYMAHGIFENLIY